MWCVCVCLYNVCVGWSHGQLRVKAVLGGGEKRERPKNDGSSQPEPVGDRRTGCCSQFSVSIEASKR
jgi:hypothetical protein